MPKKDAILRYQLQPAGAVTSRAVTSTSGASGAADTVDGFHASETSSPSALVAVDANEDLTIGGGITLDGTLTLATGSITDSGGAIDFGNETLTTTGYITAATLNLSAVANQVVMQYGGVTGTLTWTPATANKTITLPNLTGTTALGAGTATVATANSVAVADHTHAVTSSANPGAAASLLASTADGYLQVVGLGVSAAPTGAELRVDGDLVFVGAQSISTTADNLTLAPAGDIIFNPTGNDLLPTSGYDLNIGSLAKKYLTLHAAELWVETLVAQNTIATIGGRILVGPTTVLSVDLGDAVGNTTITVKHNNLANGDRVVMQADAKLEWMSIDSDAGGGAGAYTYTVTRDLDGTGRNLWYAGDAVFDTGTTGDGFIDLYSVAGVIAGATAGPTIVGNVRYGATYNEYREAWAIGNLNGLYGYAADTYGVGLGQYSAADYITIDPTNGVRFLDSADVVQAQLTGGVWTIGEVAASHSNVQITAGAVNLRTNAVTHIALQTDGDVFIGEDVSAAATTNIAIFTAAQAYNGENVLAGDFLIGDNTAGVGAKANIFWDKADGQLRFRGGVTTQAYVDTDGSILAGAGVVKLDSTGLRLLDTGTTNSWITWKYDTWAGDTIGYVRADWGGGVGDDIIMWVGGYKATGVTAGTANVILTAVDVDASRDVRIDMASDGVCSFDGGANSMFLVGTTVVNTKMTNGITIDQDAADTEIFAVKSSDVGHGMTDFADASTFGSFIKAEATSGGLQINGYKDAAGVAGKALLLYGRLGEAADTTKSTAAVGVVHVTSAVESGTALAAVGANGNLMTITNYGTCRFIFDAEGSAHGDVEFIAFDDQDDVALLDNLQTGMLDWKQSAVKHEFDGFLTEHQEQLEELGIVHFDRGNPGHAMLNTTRLSMLLVGAIRQQAARIEGLERRLLEA